jgi:hypothetical protein
MSGQVIPKGFRHQTKGVAERKVEECQQDHCQAGAKQVVHREGSRGFLQIFFSSDTKTKDQKDTKKNLSPHFDANLQIVSRFQELCIKVRVKLSLVRVDFRIVLVERFQTPAIGEQGVSVHFSEIALVTLAVPTQFTFAHTHTNTQWDEKQQKKVVRYFDCWIST